MEFNEWIACRELVSRIGAMPDIQALDKNERKIFLAIAMALAHIGTNWKGFEAAFLAAMGEK